jgi:hypothetical protein
MEPDLERRGYGCCHPFRALRARQAAITPKTTTTNATKASVPSLAIAAASSKDCQQT